MKRKKYLLSFALFVAALLVPNFPVVAATLSGTISDTEGATVAGAQIIVRQPGTDFSEMVLTEEDGSYFLESLPPGVYTVTVRKPGYADLVQERVAAGNPGETVRLDLQLRPSQEQTTVRATEELNPNIFIVKLDTNEINRNLDKRGANIQFLREFRSQENNYGAMYGQPLRRTPLLRPHSPLRNFHGSLYNSHQNSALNARSFFTVGSLRPSRRNQYGGTVGGPISEDKLSFDFAWSQTRDSGFVNGNVQAPLENERTPRSSDPQVNAVIARLLEGFPEELPNLPNISARQLNTNALRDIRRTAVSTRLDYRLGESDQIALEQRFLDATEVPFEIVAGQNPDTFLRPQSFHLTNTHTFSPNTLARLSVNFDRLSVILDITERYENLLAPLGIDVVPQISFGQEITGLGGGASLPRRRVENRFSFAPEVTRVSGKHTLSAGFRIARLRINDLQSDNSRGQFSFTRNNGRSAVENFLHGTPTSFTIALGDLYRGFRNWENAVYLQDTIRASSRWTFSLGLRYEMVTAPTEVNGLTSIPYSTDANNFAPQFGFAWNPGGGKTVVRGGYGIAFGSVFPILYQRARFNPPEVQVITIDNPDLLNPLGGAAEVKKSALNLLSPDLVVPYTHMYNFGIERELPANLFFRIAYIGSRTFKLPTKHISNRAQPVAGICKEREGFPYLWCETKTINQRRPNPDFLQITTIAGTGISYFDGMQVSVDKRMGGGLTWNARYTFSKAINTTDTHFAQIGTGFHNSTIEDVVGDLRGLSRFDTPHALTIGYRFELPWARNQRGIRALLLGGWKVSGTTTFQSGTPSHAHTGSDSPGFGNVDGVGGDRPNLLNPSILWKSLDHPDTAPLIFARENFDTIIPPGGRGNLGYLTFRNDGTHNWNIAVEKDFSAGETGNVQFRAEFLNSFNQPHFDEVRHVIAADTFGKILNTSNKGRVIQLMLRFRM
ncbi:MAG: TonB-dependent receptor [Acidobacteria bacterium]|nr:TonB-dependent receptor [Acidobacteriota bacterium]